MHGYDIAHAAGRKWRIELIHAAMVVQQFFVPVVQTADPRTFVNAEQAAGLQATYELHLRGGGRLNWVFEDGSLRVEEPSVLRIDCYISADPAAFFMVFWNRQSQWNAIAKGQLVAWGRKPWLGLKFRSLMRSPLQSSLGVPPALVQLTQSSLPSGSCSVVVTGPRSEVIHATEAPSATRRSTWSDAFGGADLQVQMPPVLGSLRLRYSLEEQAWPSGVGVIAGRHVPEGAATADLDDAAVVLLLVLQRLRPKPSQGMWVGCVEDDLDLRAHAPPPDV
jgi:hypothetical protein